VFLLNIKINNDKILWVDKLHYLGVYFVLVNVYMLISHRCYVSFTLQHLLYFIIVFLCLKIVYLNRYIYC